MQARGVFTPAVNFGLCHTCVHQICRLDLAISEVALRPALLAIDVSSAED